MHRNEDGRMTLAASHGKGDASCLGSILKRDKAVRGLGATLALGVACGLGAMAVRAAGETASPTGDWKPRIHFYAGPLWNNDPNGPILINGQYNLFFQANPYGDQWGHMSWGHAVSRDLVHWRKLRIALPEADGVMNFNGTVVEDRDNTSGLCGDTGKAAAGCLVAVYTGDSMPSPGQERQNQNLAFSRDGGLTWTRYAKNPVLDLKLKDFRDPKVFWHEPSHSWVMVVMLADQHRVQIYRSPDLKQWELASEFGPAGATGGVWECPDLMNLDVRDAKGSRIGSHWVMSVNLNPGGVAGGSGNQYFVGQFDGTRFTEDHPGSGMHWVDWGKDFYASTSFAGIPADEDRLWIAWMSNWQYAGATPPLPGRGEMTIPRRIYLRRELIEGAESLVLVQEPVLPTIKGAAHAGELTIDEANRRLGGREPGNSVYLLRATLEAGSATEIGVRLRRSVTKPNETASEETVVGISRATREVFVDRRRSGLVSFSPDFPVRAAAPLKHPDAKSISIEVLVDRNSVEVFAEDGETVLTNLIFPSDDSRGIAFYATGDEGSGASPRIVNLTITPLQ